MFEMFFLMICFRLLLIIGLMIVLIDVVNIVMLSMIIDVVNRCVVGVCGMMLL